MAHVKLNESSRRMINKDSSLFQCVFGALGSVPDDKVGSCILIGFFSALLCNLRPGP